MNNILYPGERLQECHVPPLYAICSRGQNPHIRAHKHNSWCENKHNFWFPLMEASVLFSIWSGGCMKNYLIERRYPRNAVYIYSINLMTKDVSFTY